MTQNRHLSANFSENPNGSKSVVDARNGQQQFNLREIVFGNLKDKGFQFCFVLFQRIHVAADNFQFLCLFRG